MPPLPILTPAEFSLSNLYVHPTEVQSGEVVTITVLVTHTGGIEGFYVVRLDINGFSEATKSVTLPVGGTKIATFSVIREKAGSYSVTVDDLSASFTVLTPSVEESAVEEPPVEKPPVEKLLPEEETTKSEPNWVLILGIVVGVAVLGGLVYFIWRGRFEM